MPERVRRYTDEELATKTGKCIFCNKELFLEKFRKRLNRVAGHVDKYHELPDQEPYEFGQYCANKWYYKRYKMVHYSMQKYLNKLSKALAKSGLDLDAPAWQVDQFIERKGL